MCGIYRVVHNLCATFTSLILTYLLEWYTKIYSDEKIVLPAAPLCILCIMAYMYILITCVRYTSILYISRLLYRRLYTYNTVYTVYTVD